MDNIVFDAMSTPSFRGRRGEWRHPLQWYGWYREEADLYFAAMDTKHQASEDLWRWVEAVAPEVRFAQGSSGLLQGLGGLHRNMSEVDGTISCWVRVSCGPADMVYVEATTCFQLAFPVRCVCTWPCMAIWHLAVKGPGGCPVPCVAELGR